MVLDALVARPALLCRGSTYVDTMATTGDVHIVVFTCVEEWGDKSLDYFAGFHN